MSFLTLGQVKETWVVVALWSLLWGILASLGGGFFMLYPLIVFALLSLPLGVLAVPLVYYVHLRLGAFVWGDGFHFSDMSLVLLVWVASMATAYFQWRKFVDMKHISVSLKPIVLGSIVSILSVIVFSAVMQ